MVKKKYLIFEPDYKGHQVDYIRVIASFIESNPVTHDFIFLTSSELIDYLKSSTEFLNGPEECCCTDEVNDQVCCSEDSNDRSCQVALEDECCSFEHLFIRYDQDNQVSKNVNVPSDSGKDQFVYHPAICTHYKQESDSDNAWHFTHPPPVPQPLWLLHCCFTFYG